MSADRDVTTRIVRSWLHEDAHEDADRILTLVLDEIDTTPQRSASWLARRFPPMTNTFRYGIAAVFVALAAIVGFNYLAGPNVGGPTVSPTPTRFATTAELTGPWRAVPLVIDPALTDALDQSCRRDPEFPPGVALVAIDARGDGRLIAQYAGGNESADCAYGRISEGGTVSGGLSGNRTGVAPVSPGQLSMVNFVGGTPREGQPLASGAWGWVSGRAGQGIAKVVIEISGRVDVTASLQNGWFVAWWPAAIGDSVALSAFDASGAELFRRPIP